ncbi:hypothetical protein BDR05DRAFT_953111 [Suillus weaverae]|nr:hypothetical protein BDR05DRAFT_953111 [Suillus weaverae]
MSGESTPLLSGAVPTFELLVKQWKDLALHVPHILTKFYSHDDLQLLTYHSYIMDELCKPRRLPLFLVNEYSHLAVVKFVLKKDQLNFTRGWAVLQKEMEYNLISILIEIHTLIAEVALDLTWIYFMPLTLEQQHITAVRGIVSMLQNIIVTVNLKTIVLCICNAMSLRYSHLSHAQAESLCY